MASTYTANSGIEKIGAGEQAGTWGNTTNNNLDILDRAISGVAAITLSSTSKSSNDDPAGMGALVISSTGWLTSSLLFVLLPVSDVNVTVAVT